MKRKTFLFAVLLAAYPASSALGQIFWTLDRDEFHLFMEGKKVLKGIEDFEESNVGFGQLAVLTDPLVFGVPNIDAAGLGFPNGLAEENLIIQSNAFEQGLVIEPGLGMVALGQGFIDGVNVPNSVVVGAQFFAESLDLIFDPSDNHTGVGFDFIDPIGGIAFITVFDKNDEIIFKQVFEAGGEKRFFGIWSPETIGRINIGGPGGELVDNVEMWIPAPGALALLGVAGLLGARRRRRQ